MPQVGSNKSEGIDAMSEAELTAALYGSEAPNAEEEWENAENAPAEEEFEEGADGETPPDDLDENTPPGAAPNRLRLRGLSEENRQFVADLVEGLKAGKSLEEMISQDSPWEPQHDDSVEAHEELGMRATESAGQEVQRLQDRIVELRAERREAKSEFDEARVLDLTEEIEAVQLDLWRAEQRVPNAGPAAKAAREAYEQQFHATVADLLDRHPELDDEKSPLARRVSEKRAFIEAMQPDALDDPRFLLALVDQAAREVGQHRSTPIAPSKASRVVGAVVSGQVAPTGALSAEQVRGLIRDTDDADVLAAALLPR